MKTRIIVAVIFVPLIFIILFWLPPEAITVVIAAIAAIGSFELLRAVGAASFVRLRIYAAVAAVIIPIAVFVGSGDLIFRAVLFLMLAVLFGDTVLTYKANRHLTLTMLTAVLFGGVLIPYFLSAVISLKLVENGRFYVLIPFVVAFVTDGGAYFTGVFLGKHRAFPYVSPKKTVEGCIGGILTCMVVIVLYGLVLHFTSGFTVNFWAMAAYGLLGGIATELGDLAFSFIKREFGIKDYGNLLPGHGGMLDRFDSMVFAAPTVYLLMTLIPAF